MLQFLGLHLGLAAEGDLLTEEAEVRVVAEQTQHDQIRIEAV